MRRRRKPYIPITRSGSSILASLFAQSMQERARQRRERGECPNGEPGCEFRNKYPGLFFWFMLFVMFMALIFILTVVGFVSEFFQKYQANWLFLITASVLIVILVVKGFLKGR